MLLQVGEDHRAHHPLPDASSAAEGSSATEEDAAVVTEERPYKCNHCPYSAMTAKSLWAHNKNHER